MLTPVQVIVVLLLQAVPLMVAGALLGSCWARRRFASAPDRRLDDLQVRLDQLQQAMSRMEQILARPRSDAPPESAKSPPNLRSDPSSTTPPRRSRQPGQAARPGAARPETGPTLITVPDLSGPASTIGSQAESARRSAVSGDLARRFARAWEMADRGASADRIAMETKQPVGQVELVLNLRRRLLDRETGEVSA